MAKRNPLSRRIAVLCTGIGLLAAAGAGAEGDVLGRVSSVAGEATAQRPGEAPRPLACGDPVYADDTLQTSAGGRVGVLLEDVAAHLAPATRVTLGRTDASQPAARLEVGKVRMIDPRDAGDPARLMALDTRAAVIGNDAEAYIFAEKVGSYAMMCDWDAPLPVDRGDESLSADPGQCVIAKPKEPLFLADAHDTRIPADPAEACDLSQDFAVRAGDPANHLSPADVSAPGPMPGAGSAGFGGVNPSSAGSPTYASCDVGGVCAVPVPSEAFEPPPTSIPGAPGVIPPTP